MNIHVHRGKGAKDRYVPLPEETLFLLRKYWATNGNPVLIFPALGRGHNQASASKNPMAIDSVQGALRKSRHEAGIKKRRVTIHTLRHSNSSAIHYTVRRLAATFSPTICRPPVLKRIDTASIRPVKGSFIDRELREHFSDLLCKADTTDGRPGYIYCLLEHKSYPDRLVAFQLLRVMVKIWSGDLRKFRKREKKAAKAGQSAPPRPFCFAPVIPLVLYHGESKWNVPENFHALSEMADELKFYVPNFRFPVADLSEYDDDQIKGEVMLRVALLLMKYIFSDKLAERLPEILGLLRDLASRNTGLEFLETIIIYLAKGTNKLTERQLGEALQKALPDLGGDTMTTLAEKWFQEGEEKTLLEVIETGLKMKFGNEGQRLLPDIVKIDDKEIFKAIQQRLWTAASLDEIREFID